MPVPVPFQVFESLANVTVGVAATNAALINAPATRKALATSCRAAAYSRSAAI